MLARSFAPNFLLGMVLYVEFNQQKRHGSLIHMYIQYYEFPQQAMENDPGEPIASYKWTGWSSRLSGNLPNVLLECMESTSK